MNFVLSKFRVFVVKKFFIKFKEIIIDELVKSQKTVFFVIPAKAGIQSFKAVKGDLDSGFRRSDDFLREHHN